mmetsp:Transcript_20445/g.24768  ORF Transcript_20445/g.24768 Transcript_20445/m.24768 type:complete len:91 (+) Transcript_20445:891-1163(+)
MPFASSSNGVPTTPTIIFIPGFGDIKVTFFEEMATRYWSINGDTLKYDMVTPDCELNETTGNLDSIALQRGRAAWYWKQYAFTNLAFYFT